MSANLKCKEFDGLVQTPTYITELCYWADFERKIVSPWQTILHKYLSWIRATRGNNGVYDTKGQEYKWVKEHEKTLQAAVKRYKKLTFYIV